jgi:hypothetical protein
MSKSQEDEQCPKESAYTTMINKAQQGTFINKIGKHHKGLEQKENRDYFIETCFEGVHPDYVATNEKVNVRKKSTTIVENVVETLKLMKGEILYGSSRTEKDIQNLFVELFEQKDIQGITVTPEFQIPNLRDSERKNRSDVLIQFKYSGKEYAFLLEFKKEMSQRQAKTALKQLFTYSQSFMLQEIIVLGLLLLFDGSCQHNKERMYCYAWPYANQLQKPKEPAPGTDGGGAAGGAQNGGKDRKKTQKRKRRGGAQNDGKDHEKTQKRKRKPGRRSAREGDAEGSEEEGAAEGHAAASNEGGEHEVDNNNVTKIVNKEQYAPLKTLQEFLLLENSEHFPASTITYITDELKDKEITLENTPKFTESKDFITFWKDWYNLFCREANISNKVYLNFSEAEENKNQHNLTFVLYQHAKRWFLCCCVETQASFQWYHIREKYDNEKQTISADEWEFYQHVRNNLGMSIRVKLFNYKFSHLPNDVSYSAVHMIYNLLLAILLRKKDKSFSIGSFEEEPSEIIPTFNSQNISKKMLFFINSQNITEINESSMKENVEGDVKENMESSGYWYVPSSIFSENKISPDFAEIQQGSVLLEPQQENNGVQYAVGIVIQKDDISFTIEFPGFTREEGLYKIFTGHYEKALDRNRIPYYAKKNISDTPSQPHIPLYLCKKETLFLNDNNNQTKHNTLVDLLVRKIELLLCAQ